MVLFSPGLRVLFRDSWVDRLGRFSAVTTSCISAIPVHLVTAKGFSYRRMRMCSFHTIPCDVSAGSRGPLEKLVLASPKEGRRFSVAQAVSTRSLRKLTVENGASLPHFPSPTTSKPCDFGRSVRFLGMKRG